MKTKNSFCIDFDYTLSEDVTLKLTASVQLQKSRRYFITAFHFFKKSNGHPLLQDIQIIAIKLADGIRWLHTDSFQETILSAAVGKAIEARGKVAVVNKQ